MISACRFYVCRLCAWVFCWLMGLGVLGLTCVDVFGWVVSGWCGLCYMFGFDWFSGFDLGWGLLVEALDVVLLRG